MASWLVTGCAIGIVIAALGGPGAALPADAPVGPLVEASYTFVRIVPDQAPQETEDIDVEGEPECSRDAFGPMNSTAAAGFVFNEAHGENGCAMAEYRPPVPDGATHMRVVFNVSRSMDPDARSTRPPPPGFLQTFALWDHGGDAASKMPIEVFHLFDPTDASHPLAPQRFDLDLADVRAPALVWHLFDQGVGVGSAANAPSGIAWSAEVYDIEVHLPSVPVAIAQGPRISGVVGTDRVEEARAEWMLDARYQVPGHARTTYTIQIPPALVWGGLFGPDGAPVEPSAERTRSDGTTLLMIGPEVLDRHGPGVYQVAYSSRSPVVVQAAVLPIAALFALMPLVVSADVARTRSWHTSGAVGRASLPWHRVLGVAVGLGWAGVLAAVVVSGRFPLVSSWPLGAFGLTFYGVLGSVLLLAVGVWLDHRRRVVRVIRDDAEAVDRRSQELQQFLAGVTHDLKSPLVALDWLTRDLQEELVQHSADPIVLESLERIRRSVGGMDALVHDLLDLSRLEHEAAQETEADVAAITRAVVEDLHGLAASRQATVTVERIQVDRLRVVPNRLRQVLANLVGNAIKYGRPSGGQVFVAIVQRADGACCIEVRDDGPGIPPEERTQVLQMFHRGSRAADSTTEGTGIGLALVKRIVDQWGGVIAIDTAPEGGAHFRITVPAERMVRD